MALIVSHSSVLPELRENVGFGGSDKRLSWHNIDHDDI